MTQLEDIDPDTMVVPPGISIAPEQDTELVSVCFLHPGSMSSMFADSREGVLVYDIAHHRRIISHDTGYIGKECGSGGIVAGRNALAETFLNGPSTWMFMVDSDMGFAPDTVERLIAAADPVERPVVGGLAFAHKANGRKDHNAIRYVAIPTVYDWVETDDQVGFLSRIDYERDALVSCAATGGAIVLIHRRALEAIRAKYGPHWFDPVVHPSGTTFSEDLSFCIRLAGCDIPLFVHTGVKTAHDKGGIFLDEEEFDKQMMLRNLLAEPPLGSVRDDGLADL